MPTNTQTKNQNVDTNQKNINNINDFDNLVKYYKKFYLRNIKNERSFQ